MNRPNLKILCLKLESLPEDYEHFGMDDYYYTPNKRYTLPHKALSPTDCGTVACAAGHAPSAGIVPSSPGMSWEGYIDEYFELSDDEYYWCFGCEWSDVDNTHQGAAKRIRWMLANGVPDDFEDQIKGVKPLCYMTEQRGNQDAK